MENEMEYPNKKVLLIGGGGTLGRYTSAELLNKGCKVDVICLEDYISDHKNLCYFQANADLEYLTDFLSDQYYDGIVNFVHYPDAEQYKPVHMLLTSKTDQLIFLSSYRVYADLQHPITETAPQLLDVSDDKEFLENEDYAVSKSKCEHYIREESGTDNWTIVRPVISFSERRFDIIYPQSADSIKKHIAENDPIILPKDAKNLTAGLDWAGNSGKLIANLLFKEKALREAFTVSSAQNCTWGEVADMYTDICGITFHWVTFEEYLDATPYEKTGGKWRLNYDRLYDRKIDNHKILTVTGLQKDDFKPIKQGIEMELSKVL